MRMVAGGAQLLATIKRGQDRGRDNEDEDVDGDYQHGQTSRHRVWPREESGSQAAAHQRQRVCSLAGTWESY
jgi:hypothetical protein